MRPAMKRVRGAATSGPYQRALWIVGRANGRRYLRQSVIARYGAIRGPRTVTLIHTKSIQDTSRSRDPKPIQGLKQRAVVCAQAA